MRNKAGGDWGTRKLRGKIPVRGAGKEPPKIMQFVIPEFQDAHICRYIYI